MGNPIAPPRWQNITQAYPAAQCPSWYSAVAETYLRVRPHYSPETLEKAWAWAGLNPGDAVLEIGCGPGIATRALAQRGAVLTCLEPSAAACELTQAWGASENYAVEVINTTFEAWLLPPTSFAAVVAATSFHWLDPATRCAKIAACLRPQGALVLLWNVPPQPHPDVFATMAPVYAEFAPDLGQYEAPAAHQQAMAEIGETLLDSGYFADLHTDYQAWQLTYSISDYLALLSTLSPYIAISPEVRANLFAALEHTLTQAWGQELVLDCLTGVQVCRQQSAASPPVLSC